jgi:hypothetical protein
LRHIVPKAGVSCEQLLSTPNFHVPAFSYG